MEQNVQQAVPFFMVHDIKRSIRFYVDGLGFRITEQWVDDGAIRWCWLNLHSVAVMLQEFRKGGNHHDVPTGGLGLGVSIYFICRDALQVYRDMRACGVHAKRPFVGNGMWVTAVTDPDGYALFFESFTDAPEETEYDG